MHIRLLPLLALAAAACGESRATPDASGTPPPEAPRGSQAASRPAPPPLPAEGILLAATAQDSGRFTLEPIAIVTPGGLRDPWDTEDNDAFIARWLAPDTRYPVRVAGSMAGEARVLRMIEPGCTERVAEAAFTASAPLPDVWEGLASDAFGAPSPRGLLRPPTVEEANELATLADSIHASHRIPSAARAAAERQQLFAVTVPGTQVPVLVGTFNVSVPGDDGTEQTYNLMLVAESRGGAYRPAFVHHDRDDGENGVRSLFEVADLDRDGVPELIGRAMYNEGWGYTVMKRGADGWTEIYQGGGGGC